MDPNAKLLYIACVVGALALYIVVRQSGRPLKVIGTLIGLAGLAWLTIAVARLLAVDGQGAARPEPFMAIFSVIAIASAVRMITHAKPVYCALYFILVVISSASLFLMLQAEFMAFALVIVYAGAILITYVFVLMLAQQSPDPQEPGGQPEYDRVAREPMAAAVVSFVLLALLTNMITIGVPQLPAPPSAQEMATASWQELEALPKRRDELIEKVVAKVAPDGDASGSFRIDQGQAFVDVTTADGQVSSQELGSDYLLQNVQRVGLGLVLKFPVSLELAGIILLMAMFGAVVLARRQVELGEEDVRQAAGLQARDHGGDEEPDTNGTGGDA
jgi:NADH-quinone oxidoreductase subunit J